MTVILNTKSMKQSLTKVLIVVTALAVVLSPVFLKDAAEAQAISLPGVGIFNIGTNPITTPFGGKIIRNDLKFCLKAMPAPIFVLPVPFRYLEVDDVATKSIVKLYYLYFISKQYREYNMEVSAWSLGKYFDGMDDVWRGTICDINGSTLPEADGVIWPIGTSCNTSPPMGISCRNPIVPNDQNSYNQQMSGFNPGDYSQYCYPGGGSGTCLPYPAKP